MLVKNMPGFKRNFLGEGFYKFDPRVNFFHALGCSTRLSILKALKEKDRTVNEIAAILNVDKSVSSRHLTILRLTGIINARKEGLNVYYTITNDKIFKIIDLVTELLKEITEMKQESLKK